MLEYPPTDFAAVGVFGYFNRVRVLVSEGLGAKELSSYLILHEETKRRTFKSFPLHNKSFNR